MTTAQDILDWGGDYVGMAGDGFKAEMVWLADMASIDSPYLDGLSFDDQLWHDFAAKLRPHAYSANGIYSTPVIAYDVWQKAAVVCFINGRNCTLDYFETMDLNTLFHRVLWAADFGKKKLNVASMLKGLIDSRTPASDDELAKKMLALKLIGQPYNSVEVERILEKRLEIQTYHEQLICCIIKSIT